MCEKEARESVDAAIAAQQVDGNGHFMVSRKRRSTADGVAAAEAAVAAQFSTKQDNRELKRQSKSGKQSAFGASVQQNHGQQLHLGNELPHKCRKHPLCTRKYRHPGLCKIVQQTEPIAAKQENRRAGQAVRLILA